MGKVGLGCGYLVQDADDGSNECHTSPNVYDFPKDVVRDREDLTPSH